MIKISIFTYHLMTSPDYYSNNSEFAVLTTPTGVLLGTLALKLHLGKQIQENVSQRKVQ